MIIVNGKGWRVLLVPPSHPFLNEHRDEPALGCCDRNTQTICINNTLPKSQMRKVLCHEIVHAFMYSYSINLGYYEEEKIADIIATYGHSMIQLTNLTYKNLIQKKEGRLDK